MPESRFLPCPFCGSADLSVFNSGVWCEGCSAHQDIDVYGMDAAIASWNRRASPWQPIETAPKDGTRILLFNAECKPTEMIGSWELFGGGWWSDPHPNGDSLIWDKPTHWMPLPAPPETEG